MLDIAPASDSPRARMPLDFTPYLLSASPPTSEFHSFAASFDDFPAFTRYSPRSHQVQSKAVYGNCSLNSRRNGPLKSIIIKSDSNSDLSATSEDGESSGPGTPTSPKLRKRVSFADQSGIPLATVRIMAEPSDEPPRFNPELLANITHGAQAGVTDKPPLKLDFAQPASDYLAFRDKLESNFVSLENVILKDYCVAGTVKVKNIHFEKKVFIRYTYTSWETHEDTVCEYVPGPGEPSDRGNIYDTFMFDFEVSPSCDMSKKVEFAVCFEANGTQHWDSNYGSNYRIGWETFQEPKQPFSVATEDNLDNLNNNGPFHFGPSSLSEWASWHHIDNTLAYY